MTLQKLCPYIYGTCVVAEGSYANKKTKIDCFLPTFRFVSKSSSGPLFNENLITITQKVHISLRSRYLPLHVDSLFGIDVKI